MSGCGGRRIKRWELVLWEGEVGVKKEEMVEGEEDGDDGVGGGEGGVGVEGGGGERKGV